MPVDANGRPTSLSGAGPDASTPPTIPTPDPVENEDAAGVTAAIVNPPSNTPNTFYHKIKQFFSKATPYNEHQWIDETGKVRGQILVHSWDSESPQQFHGHMSFYVWDTSDPSGNNRHHPMNIFYGVPYAPDSGGDTRHRSRIAFDHAYFDLMDSILVIKSPSHTWEIYVDDSGALHTRAATAIPAPDQNT